MSTTGKGPINVQKDQILSQAKLYKNPMLEMLEMLECWHDDPGIEEGVRRKMKNENNQVSVLLDP